MERKVKKISYIVSLFPCWSETFILNEIIELTKAGVDIKIFSIRTDLEPFTQEKAKPFLDKTVYPSIGKVLFSAFVWFVKRPQILFPLFFKAVFSRYEHAGRIRLKNMWSIFLGCYFVDIHLREGIEHIHAHFATYPSLVATVISQLTDIPFTFTCHAHDIFLDQVLLKEKLQAAKKIVTISEYNRKYLTDKFGQDLLSKIEIIHCGLDMNEWMLAPDRNNGLPQLLAIGRLTPMKGFGQLIKACSLLKNDSDFKCHIIGDGDLKTEFVRLIKEDQLEERVVLEGVQDSAKVREFLKNTNVFVAPSVWNDQDGQDGIPLVLMEALALGVPVVASSISGIPELIEDGQTGLLVEPGNIVQLAEKLKQLMSDKALQDTFSKNGRKKIEKEFNIKINARKLLEVFNYC